MNRGLSENEWMERREHFRAALLQGDRRAVEKIVCQGELTELRTLRDELLEEVTEQLLEGDASFCQLIAISEAACVLEEHGAPVALCGSLAGNPGDTGRNFIRMLLRAWGVPSLDLGADVSVERFLQAASRQNIRFVIAVAFSEADARSAAALHQEAVERGIRDQFELLFCGARFDAELEKKLQLACPDHRAAAAARWVAKAWKDR